MFLLFPFWEAEIQGLGYSKSHIWGNRENHHTFPGKGTISEKNREDLKFTPQTDLQ